MISSTSNSQIKNIIKLQTQAKMRNKEGQFVVEGVRMFTEIPENRIVKIYVSAGLLESIPDEIKEIISRNECEVVDDNVFKQISDTVTPQGILCIVNKSEVTLADINNKKTYIILENLQDPGNLGTILRTSEGAGIDAVIMNKGTVDIYNPKVVRSTMGAIFRVPFFYADDIFETVRKMKSVGVKVYAAHLNGNKYYSEPDYKNPSAFLIGNEGNGLTEELTVAADELIKIPMCGKVESLNAANAATILMYEAFRQKGFS